MVEGSNSVLVPAMTEIGDGLPAAGLQRLGDGLHVAVVDQVVAADVDGDGTVGLVDGLDADQLGEALQGLQPLVVSPTASLPEVLPPSAFSICQVQRADLAG